MLDLTAVQRPTVWRSTRVCSANVIRHCGLIADGGRLLGGSSGRACSGDGEPVTVCRWFPLPDNARLGTGLGLAGPHDYRWLPRHRARGKQAASGKAARVVILNSIRYPAIQVVTWEAASWHETYLPAPVTLL